VPAPPDYKTVVERLADFKALYPSGCLRPADLAVPYRVETIGDRVFVVYVAAAYRTPDDPCPGIGAAWEPVPGPTNFTRDSELMNAETSAWGRAIIAVLASESKSVASQDEIHNRQASNNVNLAYATGGYLPHPLPAGWKDEAERDAVWQELRDASAALPEAVQAEVKAEVRKLGFTKATFTPTHAGAWRFVLPAVHEHDGIEEGPS